MSHQVNDEWADRASDLLPYLTTGEAMDLTGAYEAHGEFPELVAKLEAKYSDLIAETQQKALESVKEIKQADGDMWPEEWATNYQKPKEYER